jgi:hypothetical protein
VERLGPVWNARGIALAADMFAPISRALHAM